MVRTSVVWQLVTLTSVLLASPAWAQQSPSSIAGVVRDTSGAVLPGVTVEAASPVLIEKVRSVVTDGEGRYAIVDLRLGAYTVTFTLPGFSTFRREGIELGAGFTATVNANMQVGSLEETITVTGAAPLVDTQNVRQQKVLSSDLLASLPTGQMSWTTLVAVTPGMTGVADVGGAKGAWYGLQLNSNSYHGKTGTRSMFDGMRIQNFGSGGSPGYMFNSQTVQEMTVETAGLSAETSDGAMVINLIPKEGSNNFAFSVSGLYTNSHLQSDNLTDELRARGLATVDHVSKIYDAGVTVGGPISQNRLWFFGAYRQWGNGNQIAGVFWNKTQGTPFYTPDLTRPAIRNEWFRSQVGRLTWQASARNKVSFFTDAQRNCLCVYSFLGNAIEASTRLDLWPNGIVQGSWSSPITSKLLLEAGAAWVPFYFPASRQPGVTKDAIATLEQSTNFWYNAAPPAQGYRINPNVLQRWVQRFGISYVTGSHTFKFGIQDEEGLADFNRQEGTGPDGVSHVYLNGVPVSLVLFGYPYRQRDIGKADLGIYAQDNWTFKRVSLSYGLRYSFVNGYTPAIHLDAGPFVPARDFAAVHDIPNWKDLQPRLGLSYDLFGAGKTALKVSIGRYGDITGRSIISNNNPVNTSVSQVSRPWTDANKNYAPDCDMRNFTANGECGAIADQNFGKANPRANSYADDVLRGWGARFFTWDFATEVQHQLGKGISLAGGYSRNWSGNFTVTDNFAVGPSDYSPYSITAPTNPGLPGGGGYQVSGLYDINPNKFGQINNVVSRSSHYGDQTRVSDFFNISLNTRFVSGIQLGGGVDTGRTVDDACFVVDSPQALRYCHVVTPFRAQTQAKLNGSVPLPGDFLVSGTFQNLPGLAVGANYTATTAQIAPSLGRNLAGGTRSVSIPLIAPQTQFEARLTQIDVRLSKTLKLSPRIRLKLNFDVYNALNANTILTVNNAFGSSWLRPTSILDGRLVQLGGQLNF